MLKLNELINLVGKNGIYTEMVENLRKKYGANVLTPPAREPLWRQYLEKFNDPIIKILLVAVIVSAIVGFVQGSGVLDTLAIILAVMLATGISFISEYRSNREFEVLNAQRDETLVKVVRDKHPQTIAAKDVVVGDLILLESGDGVPADGWLLESDGLYVDESVLTGESEPALKKENEAVYRGCQVTDGRGTLIVAAVGDATKMGSIAKSLGIDRTKTPLEEKLEYLAQLISRFGYAMALLISLALFVRGIFHGEVTGFNLETLNSILSYFMLAVVIIVVAVPEGLPMSVAMSLALAMRKMTKANSLVRHMVACETIGSATTICTDKTGTLTKNQMEVVESSVKIPLCNSDFGIPKNAGEWIALNAAVNSTAHLYKENEKLMVIGNSTEGALLRWLYDAGLDYMAARQAFPAQKQRLFNAQRKRMSTIVEIGGRRWLLVKGAPEIIAGLCSSGKVDLNPVKELAARAIRTLAFAHREIINDDDDEHDLIWDGFVGIRDELRKDVPLAVNSCREAGIVVRMITGDNIETAKSIAKESGILNDGLIMTGEEFRSLSDEELVAVAKDIDVLARAEPMDKLRLVRALQKSGYVVAVTGDGTNDAPALKSADVGLSMGKSGTEVAREASDIILLDDAFPTIINAVWWGRALYENIQRFLQFQLTVNVGALLLAFLAPLLGFPEPFTVIQFLWVNIIMDTLAALALCSEEPHIELLKRPPVQRNENIITSDMRQAIIVAALFYTVAGILHLYTGFLGGENEAERLTVLFTAFVLAQVWNGFNCRALSGKMPPLKSNPTFFIVMSVIVAVQILIVQFGGSVFNVVPLSLETWLKLFVFTATVLLVGAILRYIPKSAQARTALPQQ